MNFELVIKNGLVVRSDGVLYADVGINSGKIAAVEASLDGDATIDARKCYVLPGGIDPHVHLEMGEGSAQSSDDWSSGTKAAAIGGTTSVIDFVEPGTNQSLLDALSQRRAMAERGAVIDYALHMTIANGDAAVSEIPKVIQAGVTSFKTYTTYGVKLNDTELIAVMSAVGENGGVILTHCENDAIIEFLRNQLIRQGKIAPQYHPYSRPVEAEGEAMERVIALANIARVPLYIVHVSSALGKSAIQRAQQRGQQVWGETCPQYLLLTEQEYKRPGFEPAKYICQPPLRSKEDSAMLWEGIQEDVFQTIGTDHCPYFFDGQKDIGKDLFTKIPGGMPGIESRLLLMHTYGVASGLISLNRWVEITSTNAARIFGLYPQKGSLLPGSDADIVIFDPNQSGIVRKEMLHEHVDYTPYEGFVYQGCPIMTIAAGKVIAKNGEFTGSERSGKFLFRQAAH